MSKNISVQEGGIGKQLTVDKLRTNLVGVGSCLWVPEDSINLGTKHISENGTFRASDDGYLGYSEVTVSGVGTATGRDPTTGEEKRVSVDPETGDLEETIIPVSIRITTLPAKVNYTNGESIDYSGIEVHAYSSTGRDLGAVPFGELVFPVTTAQGGDEWTDGQGLNAMMLYYTPHHWFHYNGMGEIDDQGMNYVHGSALGVWSGTAATYGNDDTPDTLLATRYNGENYMASVTGNANARAYLYALTPDRVHPSNKGWIKAGYGGNPPGNRQFKKVSWERYITDIPVSTVNPITIDISTLHVTQTLPVQWPSTDAGTTLETSFTINVTGGGT